MRGVAICDRIRSQQLRTVLNKREGERGVAYIIAATIEGFAQLEALCTMHC
jgi:hypothetical protein